MSTGNKTHFQSNDAFWVNTKFMYGQYKYISIENTFKNGKIYEKILKLKKNCKSILKIYITNIFGSINIVYFKI